MDEKKVQAVIDRMVSGMERCNCDLTDGFKPLRLIQNPFLCFFFQIMCFRGAADTPIS